MITRYTTVDALLEDSPDAVEILSWYGLEDIAEDDLELTILELAGARRVDVDNLMADLAQYCSDITVVDDEEEEAEDEEEADDDSAEWDDDADEDVDDDDVDEEDVDDEDIDVDADDEVGDVEDVEDEGGRWATWADDDALSVKLRKNNRRSTAR